MKKRQLSPRDIMYMIAGVVAIACMFLNWLPVELDFGMVQIEELFGKVNAFTFSGAVYELEENMGAWAIVLPDAYESLKMRSLFVVALAVMAIILYASAIAMRVMNWKKIRNLVSLGAAGCAIVTTYYFYSLISDLLGYLGIAANSVGLLGIMTQSPCAYIMLAGLVSIVCTDPVAEVLLMFLSSCISVLVRIETFCVEWVMLIVNNIGYVIADIVAVFAGLTAGGLLMKMVDLGVLAILVGLAVTAGVSYIGTMFVFRYVLKGK